MFAYTGTQFTCVFMPTAQSCIISLQPPVAFTTPWMQLPCFENVKWNIQAWVNKNYVHFSVITELSYKHSKVFTKQLMKTPGQMT